MVSILEKGKVDPALALFVELRDQLFRDLGRVDADDQNLSPSFLFGCEQLLQLPELIYAVGSPVTAVEDKHYVFLAAEF